MPLTEKCRLEIFHSRKACVRLKYSDIKNYAQHFEGLHVYVGKSLDYSQQNSVGPALNLHEHKKILRTRN